MNELIFRPIALLPLFSAISILIMIFFYMIKAKKTWLLLSLLIFKITIFLWPLGQAIQYCSSNYETINFTIYLIHTSINFLGLAWLLFAIRFTSADGTIDCRKLVPLLILPLISYTIFLTNNYHHLYFQIVGYDPKIVISVKYGWLFWFGVIHYYGYIIAGILILTKYSFKQTGINKSQSLILAFSPAASFLVSIAFNLYNFAAKITVPSFFDLTPTFFAISMFLFSIATFKYRFLDINPGALKKTFENLHDSILLIDNFNFIVNLNLSFIKNFGVLKINTQIDLLVNQFRAVAKNTEESARILQAIESGIDNAMEMGEISFGEPLNKTYQVVIQKIDQSHKAYRGRIVTFHDITEYQRLVGELNLKNQDLSVINQRLKKHVQTLEELAIVKERNRVAREIHDKLGHTLTALIMLMKAVKIESEIDTSWSEEKLAVGITIAQKQMTELRKAIGEVLSQEPNRTDLIENIDSLIRQSANLGIEVEFAFYNRENYDKLPASSYKYRLADTVYKICKEAIANSRRHGKASQVNIILKFSLSLAKLYIIDNGKGCKKVIKGFGLTAMSDRVEDLDGIIKFSSDGESGFNIQVELPLESIKKKDS